MLISRPDVLSEAKLAFVHAYCDCERDLAAACEKLGITVEDGKEILKDVKVSRGILYEMNLRQSQGIDEENILRQVARMSFFDPRKMVDKEDNLLPLHELPDEIAAAITGIKITKRVLWEGHGRDREAVGIEHTFDYRFCDRNQSVEKLMKFMGMFEMDNRQKGDAVAEMLKQVYADSTTLPLVEHKPRSIVGPKVEAEAEPEDKTLQAVIVTDWQNPYARRPN